MKQKKKKSKSERNTIIIKVLQTRKGQPKITQSKTETKESPFLKWLKPFLQIIAIMVSLIAVFFAYKTYSDNRPEQVHLRFYTWLSSSEVNEKRFFISLLNPDNRSLMFDNENELHKSSPFPFIVNPANKSIKNLRVDVNIKIPCDIDFKENDINSEFEISHIDTIKYAKTNLKFLSVKCHYKYDVLPAKSTISAPLKCVFLKDDICFSDSLYHLKFNYSIGYDGIIKPMNYSVHLFTCFNNEDTINNLTIRSFIAGLYRRTYTNDQSVITIRDRVKLITLDISQDSDKFAGYSKTCSDIIKKYRESNSRKITYY